tara:strand:+ start:6530 stop:7699 length:1170 start_codon:yes stop_codon:yes gene_type:complete
MAGPMSPFLDLYKDDEEEMQYQYRNPYSLTPIVEGGIEQRQYEADLRKPKFEYTPTFFGEDNKDVAPGYYDNINTFMGGEEQRQSEADSRKQPMTYTPKRFEEVDVFPIKRSPEAAAAFDKEQKAIAKQEAYESKSFLEKMFDKDVREGESISNADKTFASMNAISRRLLEPRNPGEYRSFLGDIALGLDDAGQAVKALETEAYNKKIAEEDRATDKAAANLEALFKQAQINEATARTSKTMADEQKVYADMNIDQSKEYRAGLTDAANIAVDLRQASLLDPSADQPSDLLTNDAKNAMIVVQGETGLGPGDAGYAAAVAAELIKGYSLDQQKAMLEALSFEYISMVEDPSLQQQLTDIKNSLVMNMAGAQGSGSSGNTVSYQSGVLNN